MIQQIDSTQDARPNAGKGVAIQGMRSAAGRFVLALTVLLSGFLGLAISGTTQAQAETRSLKMYYTHTKETIDVTFKKNGRYDKGGLKKLNRFLRDFRRNEPTNMDPELFDLVWEVYQKSGSRKTIQVISGYRSPKTNNMLRSRGRNVAKTSQHTMGKALDFFLPDVSVDKLRALGLQAHRGGVGYYGGSFVHLDTGRVRHWPRMSARQLAKVFPKGDTIHVPSNGKPLKGYNTAMANLKKGRNADGSRRGSEVKQSLLARLFSRSGDDDDEDGETDLAPTPVRKPAPAAKPEPKEVLVAKAAPKLPKAQSGPNVFASEASALKQNEAKAAEAQLAAQIAADGRRALEDKAAADRAEATADAEPAPEAEPAEENLIAALRPEQMPVPRRRPAQSTLTALAPATEVETPSPTQLALAPAAVPIATLTPSPPVPQARVLRPRADVPETAASVPEQQTASLPEKVLEPVIEIESITRPEVAAQDTGEQPSENALEEGTLVAIVPGVTPTGRPAGSGVTVSEEDVAGLAGSIITSVEADGTVSSSTVPTGRNVGSNTRPSARPSDGPAIQTAALEQPVAEISAPVVPSWRDGEPKAPIVTPETVLAKMPASTTEPVASIAILGGSALKPALSIGDLESPSMKVWAIASSTRVGEAAKLRAPDYSQSTRRAAPGSVYSEGFARSRAPWRSDSFSGDRPLRVAFADLPTGN